MTLHSMFWPTTGVGHGPAGGYSDANWGQLLRALLVGDGDYQGVFLNYANQLAVTAGTGEVHVDQGAAIVRGFFVHNDAEYDIAIATPTLGTTGHRIVLRASYAAQEVNPTLISSADGVAAIPDRVQTENVTWDIDLAHVSVTTGGVISVTDARSYLHYNTAVSASMIDNRTRSFFASATSAYNLTTATPIAGVALGMPLHQSESSAAYGHFTCPADFVSGLTVTPIVVSFFSSGDVRLSADASYSAVGEDYGTHTANVAEATLAITGDIRTAFTALSLASLAAGDHVICTLTRDGADVLDTLGDNLYVTGFLVSYTADS